VLGALISQKLETTIVNEIDDYEYGAFLEQFMSQCYNI